MVPIETYMVTLWLIFAIVGIAIIFDRVSQAFGKRLQKHAEVVHG